MAESWNHMLQIFNKKKKESVETQSDYMSNIKELYLDNQKTPLWPSYSSNTLMFKHMILFSNFEHNQDQTNLKRLNYTARIASTVGEAKTSPQIAAVSIPSPTYPACAGSCPLPPPEFVQHV